jgi:hypothetical protein
MTSNILREDKRRSIKTGRIVSSNKMMVSGLKKNSWFEAMYKRYRGHKIKDISNSLNSKLRMRNKINSMASLKLELTINNSDKSIEKLKITKLVSSVFSLKSKIVIKTSSLKQSMLLSKTHNSPNNLI